MFGEGGGGQGVAYPPPPSPLILPLLYEGEVWRGWGGGGVEGEGEVLSEVKRSYLGVINVR